MIVRIPVELKYCESCGRPFIHAKGQPPTCPPCIKNPPTEEEEIHIIRSYRLSQGVKI